MTFVAMKHENCPSCTCTEALSTLPTKPTSGEVAEALAKATHTGHRIHLLMHPDDKWILQTLIKAAQQCEVVTMDQFADIINDVLEGDWGDHDERALRERFKNGVKIVDAKKV